MVTVILGHVGADMMICVGDGGHMIHYAHIDQDDHDINMLIVK